MLVKLKKPNKKRFIFRGDLQKQLKVEIQLSVSCSCGFTSRWKTFLFSCIYCFKPTQVLLHK